MPSVDFYLPDSSSSLRRIASRLRQPSPYMEYGRLRSDSSTSLQAVYRLDLYRKLEQMRLILRVKDAPQHASLGFSRHTEGNTRVLFTNFFALLVGEEHVR